MVSLYASQNSSSPACRTTLVVVSFEPALARQELTGSRPHRLMDPTMPKRFFRPYKIRGVANLLHYQIWRMGLSTLGCYNSVQCPRISTVLIRFLPIIFWIREWIDSNPLCPKLYNRRMQWGYIISSRWAAAIKVRASRSPSRAPRARVGTVSYVNIIVSAIRLHSHFWC